MAGRLLEFTLEDPYANLALEEALFRLMKVPVLRVWENQRSVIIGRAQLAAAETDLGACRAGSIPVVRRFSAGGAVYNGPGNLNWTFLTPPVEGRAFDAAAVFGRHGRVVARALSECGASCSFEPPNRIVSSAGKVSGMAAYMGRSGTLCHGTLLVSADLAEVARLTTPAPGEVPPRYPRSRAARTANCGVVKEDFVRALAAASGGDWERSDPTEGELQLARELTSARYSLDSWNLGDPFALDYL